MRNDGTGFRASPVFHRPPVVHAVDRCVSGYSMLELLVVLVVAAIAMTVGVRAFSGYQERSSAYRSAQVFARDLSLARSNAVQTRRRVVVRFSESDLEYEVENSDSRRLALRIFGEGGDLRLDSLDLGMPGDSLSINGRGVLDLSGLGETLGTAAFTSGTTTFRVSFNALGASKIEEP